MLSGNRFMQFGLLTLVLVLLVALASVVGVGALALPGALGSLWLVVSGVVLGLVGVVVWS